MKKHNSRCWGDIAGDEFCTCGLIPESALAQLEKDNISGKVTKAHTLISAIKEAAAKVDAGLRELTSAERKACPVVTGVLHYFPDAIMAVSRVSKAGNDKHNPGEPLHWARGKSNDHLDSEGRHLLTPSAADPDSGESEAAHKAWRALADLQIAEEKRLVAAGIKPLSGVLP